MKKSVELYLPVENISLFEDHKTIISQHTPEGAPDSFSGLNRALSWIANCDCAILSGWRQDKPRKVNDANNQAICKVLRKNGFGVSKCRGFYTEAGRPTGIENSFFTFDHEGTSDYFFNLIRTLSERYQQDCFLFKKSHDRYAYLFGTNDAFGKGRREQAGELHIGSFENRHQTRFGSGAIAFYSKVIPSLQYQTLAKR